MRNALAPLVDAVALFMDNPADEVREAVARCGPSLLQFHGGEDDAFCRSFGVPYIKAIAMGGRRHRRRRDGAAAALSGRGGVPVRQPWRRRCRAAAASRSTGRAFPTGLTNPSCLPAD